MCGTDSPRNSLKLSKESASDRFGACELLSSITVGVVVRSATILVTDVTGVVTVVCSTNKFKFVASIEEE